MDKQAETDPQEREFVTSKAGGDSLSTLAAHRLLNHKRRIIDYWENEVRSQVPEIHGNSSLVISNTLPKFLEELASALKEGHFKNELLAGMGKIHGEQRALLSGYFLPQLLKEFSILRCVINKELFEHEVSSFEVETIVNGLIDAAISQAATEFSKVQNERVEVALNKARASNTDLDHFAAIAAHDLKSPLATISGYLELVKGEFEEKLEPEVVGYIQTMSAAADRMRNLIDRLLEYARLTKVDRPFQPASVLSVVKAAYQNLTGSIERIGAEITYGSLPTVNGDIDLLIQLFQNLIANAIKFHGQTNPRVHVEAKPKGNMWLFSIADNGIGFDPKDKEQIFALYKKLHSETEFQGTGIGLATCRRVVELHGGKIWADSAPGRGSTFYFTLPQISQKLEGDH